MSLNILTIEAPILKSLRIKEVGRFMLERAEYVKTMKTHNEQRSEGEKLHIKTLKSCIEKKILNTIVNYELQTEEPVTTKTVTSKILREFLLTQLPSNSLGVGAASLEHRLSVELEITLKNLVEAGHELTVIDWVRELWVGVTETIRIYRLEKDMNTRKGIKLLYSLMSKHLSRFTTFMRRWKQVYYSVKTPEEAHENMASFYSVLIRCARDQEHQDQLLGVHTSFRLTEEDKKRKFGKKYDPNHRQKKRRVSMGDQKDKKRSENSEKKKYATTSRRAEEQQAAPRRRAHDRKITCYHCHQQGHIRSECPKLRRKNDESRRNQASRDSDGVVGALQSKNAAKQELVDCWIGPQGLHKRALLDSGAFTCFTDAQCAKDAGLELVEAQLPHELPLAVSQREAKVFGAAKGSIELARPIDGKKLRVRNVTFVLLEGVRFTIIGKDILDKIGISPTQQLNKLAVDCQYQPSINSLTCHGENPNGNEPESSPGGTIIDEGIETSRVGDAQEARARLRKALDEMLQQSKSVFNTDELYSKLKKLVYDFEDIWRVSLLDDVVFGNTKPIRVKPYDIRLKENAISRTARMRSYNRLEREFLKKMTEDLVSIKCLYRNHESRWSSPSYVVTKPGKPGTSVDHFRWTGDIRYVNSMTQRLATSMPLMSTMLEHLTDAKVFACLDCHKGYWQIPITKRSQEICSFLTPHGIFSPTRLMQGHTDSVAVFQQTMEKVFDGMLYDKILIWIDDLLSHARNAEELLPRLQSIFERCREYNLRISPDKTELGLKEIKWCGRIISGNGISFDPKMIQGLLDLDLPTNAAELQHLLTASNWLRISLPRYSEKVSDMTKMLKEAQKEVGSAKKNRLERLRLQWNEDGMKSFERLKDLLRESVTIAHFKYRDDYKLCLFTDASDKHWGIMLTQVGRQSWESSPLESQTHEPLAFMSGSFSGSHLNWPMIIKEGYPIVVALDRLRQYLSLKEFVLYTDHRNLVFLFNHLPRANDVKKNVCQMIQRWHVRLMGFNYTIEHIAGSENVWADILSRYRARSTPVLAAVQCTSNDELEDHRFISTEPDYIMDIDAEDCKEHARAFVNSDQESGEYIMDVDASDLVISLVGAAAEGLEEIDIITAAIKGSCPINYTKIVEEIKSLKKDNCGKIIVEAHKLRISLMVLAHCGLSGHRGVTRTIENLKAFTWPGIKEDVETFCQKCLHCLTARSHGLKTILRSQLHAKKPNDILHFDFLYVEDKEYLLVVKDDLSGFVELFPCEHADHFAVADSLLQWNARYGLKQGAIFISDQGSHFKNRVIEELTRILGVTHRFTPAHVPHANGTVEVVNKIFLKLLRALRSEFQIKEWKKLVSFIQASLNSTPTKSLKGFSPMHVFVGFHNPTPISLLFDSCRDVVVSPRIPDFVETLVEELSESLSLIHREVHAHKEHNRAVQRKSRNRGKKKVQYHQGDYVLLRLSGPGKKSYARNLVHVVVSVVSDHVYRIQHMLTGVQKDVHAERLLPFTSKNIDEKLLKEYVLFHTSYDVDKLLRFRTCPTTGVEQVLVKWVGFEEDESTWEPVTDIEETLPQLIKELRERLPGEGSVED